MGDPLAERPDETGRLSRLAECEVHGMELVASVPAVLLPFPPHPVHGELVHRVVDRVDRRGEETIDRLVACRHPGSTGPCVCPPPHPDPGDGHNSRASPDVELKPLDRLVVERLEPVVPLRADESCPRMIVRVEKRGAGGIMPFLHHQLDDRPRGRIDGEPGPPDPFLCELEGQGRSLPLLEPHVPLVLSPGGRRDSRLDCKRAGREELEVFFGGNAP